MLHDPKTFDVTTARPIASPVVETPRQSAVEAAERREQNTALAVMLGYIAVLAVSVGIFGLKGLVGWALVSAALAGSWVIYTTRGIRGADSD
jgi:uncharacterized membrane protein YqjE